MEWRRYNAETDQKHVQRIWLECGWIDGGEDENKGFDIFLEGNNAWVALMDGAAETLVITTESDLQYLGEQIPMAAVTGVTTSHIARRQGFAGRLTARAIGKAVEAGAAIAGLGIFDQGFYNKLGFGNGPYERWLKFDPASLRVNLHPRVPTRITADDWEAMHASRLNRMRAHGSVSLYPPCITHSEAVWGKKHFGLGYYDGPNGELTHFFTAKSEGSEGPARIGWLVYQTYDQLIELLAVMKNLSDQILTVSMHEPINIQMQDLLDRPFRNRNLTEKSKHENRMFAASYWQLRICDLAACMEKTHLLGNDVRFNLKLSDPIERYLAEDAEWRGIAGNYVVTLGANSSAVPGHEDDLPTLETTVNAFTRLWMGVRPATSLTVTDTLNGPPELLRALDLILRIPEPHNDWEY